MADRAYQVLLTYNVRCDGWLFTSVVWDQHAAVVAIECSTGQASGDVPCQWPGASESMLGDQRGCRGAAASNDRLCQDHAQTLHEPVRSIAPDDAFFTCRARSSGKANNSSPTCRPDRESPRRDAPSCVVSCRPTSRATTNERPLTILRRRRQ